MGSRRDVLDNGVAANEVLPFRYKGRVGAQLAEYMLVGMTRIKNDEDFLGPVYNLFDPSDRLFRRATPLN